MRRGPPQVAKHGKSHPRADDPGLKRWSYCAGESSSAASSDRQLSNAEAADRTGRAIFDKTRTPFKQHSGITVGLVKDGNKNVGETVDAAARTS